jgi:hypothetical protein
MQTVTSRIAQCGTYFPAGQGLGTRRPVTLSNAIDIQLPDGTHWEVDVQLVTYEDQLRNGRRLIHNLAEIERTQ